MVKTKIEWISTFRKVGDSILVELSKTKKSKNDKASEINKRIKEFRDGEIASINIIAKRDAWDNQSLLNEILLLTYASYMVEEVISFESNADYENADRLHSKINAIVGQIYLHEN